MGTPPWFWGKKCVFGESGKMTFFGWVGGHHLMMMVIPRKEWLADNHINTENLLSSFVFNFLCLSDYRLTHTPDITSGRGWTLVNVGFTMAIAILGVK